MSQDFDSRRIRVCVRGNRFLHPPEQCTNEKVTMLVSTLTKSTSRKYKTSRKPSPHYPVRPTYVRNPHTKSRLSSADIHVGGLLRLWKSDGFDSILRFFGLVMRSGGFRMVVSLLSP